MKYQNVILPLHFTLQDENIKCDVNVSIKIKKPRFFHVWLFGVDNVQIKHTSNHIRNAVKYCAKTCYLNGKIHNGSE